ncbi:MAG TPA: hypothetical protein DGN59_01920, partial [Candidatus Latescibacteria bacterium]|nr:hypothetical protein [Candidatus Latescibacterota bacterium]
RRRCLHSELVRDIQMDPRQQGRLQQVGVRLFSLEFVMGEPQQKVRCLYGRALLAQQRLKSVPDPRFPIDEGSVAV